MTEQKFVSRDAERPNTWHRDPDCSSVVMGKLVEATEDDLFRETKPCNFCAGGIWPSDLEEIGKQEDTA